jgi:hypothetical protein
MADEIKFKVNADTGSAEKKLDNLGDDIDGVTKKSGKLSGSFAKAGKGLKSFGSTMSAVGSTIKTGLGLGLLLGLLDALKNIFGENQQVVDLMNQAMVVMQGAVNGLIEVLKPLFTWLGKAFKDPQKWWDDLVKSFKDGAAWIKTNMIDQVLNKFTEWANNAKIAVLELRKSWNEFTGDTEEAEKIGKEIDALNKQNIALAEANAKKMAEIKRVANVVKDGVVGAITTIAKATKKAFDNKDVLANAEANIQRLQTLYQGIVEKYDLMSEKQRQIRDDENKTIDDRIAANLELQKVLDEGAQKEKENINARIGIIQMQQNILGKNKERTNEILALQQELTGVEAKYAGLVSETLTNQVSLGKEVLDMQKAMNESKANQLEITNASILADKQSAVDKAGLIKNEFEQFKAVKDAEAELRKEEIRQLDELNAKRQAQFDEQLSQLNQGTAAYNDALIAKTEAQAQYDSDRKVKTTEFETWAAQKDKEARDMKIANQEAIVGAVSGALSSLTALVGESTAMGKSMMIAQAIIDTYAGATKALAQGGVLGYIGAASVIATGIANIKKMTETDIPGASDSGSTPSMGPSVSIIGGSADPSAQLARQFSQQNQKPVKAYTVGTDMSSQQALDRRIQTNATFPG